METTLTATGPVAGLWSVDNEAYHADTDCVSQSALDVFRRSIPLYHAIYVAKTMQRPGPTPAMVLGSAVHALIFERDQFDDLFAVAPDVDLRTKAGKADWAAFEESAAGRRVLTADQHWQAKLMAEGVESNDIARHLLELPGRSEQAIRWRDERTGIWLKAKFDRLLDSGIVLDAKTTIDPDPAEWARQAYRYGTHRGAAHYIEGREAALGIPAEREYLHVLVGSTPPYDCVVVELDEDALRLGEIENQQLLTRLAVCREADNWTGLYANDIQRVSLPRYAFSNP